MPGAAKRAMRPRLRGVGWPSIGESDTLKCLASDNWAANFVRAIVRPWFRLGGPAHYCKSLLHRNRLMGSVECADERQADHDCSGLPQAHRVLVARIERPRDRTRARVSSRKHIAPSSLSSCAVRSLSSVPPLSPGWWVDGWIV